MSKPTLADFQSMAANCVDAADPKLDADFQALAGKTPRAFMEMSADEQDTHYQGLLDGLEAPAMGLPRFEDGDTILARNSHNPQIKYAICRFEGSDSSHGGGLRDSVTLNLRQVMRASGDDGHSPADEKFVRAVSAGVGSYAGFQRVDVMKISPIHLARVISMNAGHLDAEFASRSVEAVVPPAPEKADFDKFIDTTHVASIAWGWHAGLLHNGAYKTKVVYAVVGALKAAEAQYESVRGTTRFEFSAHSVAFAGSNLEQVQAAAKDVAKVLLAFEGVVPLAGAAEKLVQKSCDPDVGR